MARKSLSSFFIFLIGIVILLVLAAIIWLKTHSKPHRKPSVPTVAVETIQAKPYQPTIEVVGMIDAIHGVTLKASNEGQVTAIHFKSNDLVKRGKLLVEVNPEQLKAELASQKAEMLKEKLSYDRDKILLSKNTISQANYDAQRASYQQSVAAVKEAKAALDQAMVTAPFDGKMGIRQVQVGDYLDKGDTIATLIQLDPLWVNFDIPTKYLAQVKIGQSVKVANQAFANQTFVGTVTSIAPNADKSSDSFQVRATLNNAQKLLIPGLSADVTLLVGEKTDILSVPAIAIIYSNQGTSVYTVKDNKATLRSVKIGDQVGQNIIIRSGLKSGETIVVAGVNKIHGTSSEIIPEKTAMKQNAS